MHDFSNLCVYSIEHATITESGHIKQIIRFHVPGSVITFKNDEDITIIERLITEGKRFSDSWEDVIKYVEYMISEENALNCRQYMQDYTI